MPKSCDELLAEDREMIESILRWIGGCVDRHPEERESAIALLKSLEGTND